MSNLSDYAEAIEQDHAGDTILQHADDLQRGAGYFRFQLEPFVTRRSRTLGVEERVFKVRLQQVANIPANVPLYQLLASALNDAFNSLIQRTDIRNNDQIYYSFGSDRLEHVWEGWGVHAGEWRNHSDRVQRMFDNLA